MKIIGECSRRRTTMKQNEVVVRLKDIYYSKHRNTVPIAEEKEALTHAIKCEELMPEFVRLAEESISFYFHDGGYPCLIPKDCYKCKVEELLKKAKEIMG